MRVSLNDCIGSDMARTVYPKSFELGQPFAINYTWSFKTCSELYGDEYPPENPKRYPWTYR